MAEKVLKEVESQLSCSICLDTYSDPKILRCFHVYCRKCLVKLVVKDQDEAFVLSCPICRQVTPVPANGVTGLQQAFHINHFLEIVYELNKVTAHLSTNEGKEEGDSANLTPLEEKKVCCPDHSGKEVELYCEACEVPICYKCAIKGGKHHSHEYKELGEAFEECKAEITASLEPMNEKLAAVEKALKRIDAHCSEISRQQVSIEDDIRMKISELHKILEERMTKLISQLRETAQRKLKSLATQRDQVETTKAQLSSCVSFIQETLQTGHQAGMLMAKRATVKRVKMLSDSFSLNRIQPLTTANMIFSTSEGASTACRNYGHVATLESPCPSQSHATGKGMEMGIVGGVTHIVLQALNFKGLPCEEPGESVECELISELTGVKVQGNIQAIKPSRYRIGYQPSIKGKHQLHVKVGGQHIYGSPFSVVARSPVTKLGAPILTVAELEQPCGIALSQWGEVIVTECGASCVSMLTPCGEKIRSFGKHGSDWGNFHSPIGVAVTGEGNILVTDYGNDRIQKFTGDGQFIKAVGDSGSTGHLKFHRPTGITFSSVNSKVYVTGGYDCVQILNSNLTFSGTFGRHGSGKGHFQGPHGIACDSLGKVYVADYYNDRVQVFSPDGKFERLFGYPGDGKGDLSHPFGIAVDSNDMVYVSEAGNRRVSVFTSAGEFVTLIDGSEADERKFGCPCGVAVDNSGVVYVCDRDNNHILFF